jgi:hypothetical protein
VTESSFVVILRFAGLIFFCFAGTEMQTPRLGGKEVVQMFGPTTTGEHAGMSVFLSTKKNEEKFVEDGDVLRFTMRGDVWVRTYKEDMVDKGYEKVDDVKTTELLVHGLHSCGSGKVKVRQRDLCFSFCFS